MKDAKTCEIHEEKIKNIQTEFGKFKTTVMSELREIKILATKPIFTDSQVIGIVVMAVVYTVAIMMYINPIAAQSKQNLKELDRQDVKYDNMMNLLIDIKEVVDKNEGRNENK